MFHALTWFLVVGLLLAWSLAAWAFHAVATWVATQSGSIAGSTEAIQGLSMPAWLAPWVPAEWWSAGTALLSDFAPLLDGLLAAMPSLSGPLSILVWVIWAVVAFFIVLLGVVGSGLIVHFGRKPLPRLPAPLRLGSDHPSR